MYTSDRKSSEDPNEAIFGFQTRITDEEKSFAFRLFLVNEWSCFQGRIKQRMKHIQYFDIESQRSVTGLSGNTNVATDKCWAPDG